MENYFNIRYEFEPARVHSAIAERLGNKGSDYICVADGNIVKHANFNPDYRKTVNGGMFSICDSSYVPLYLEWIYGIKRFQYCGSQIFEDIVSSKKYRMYFLGTSANILRSLKENLSQMNPEVRQMEFEELPFCSVEEFDYPAIGKKISRDNADIIWVALGAPKQEEFMARLQPYLDHGVMIAVGAAFKFFAGVEAKRAPEWMIRNHLEFVFRIFSEPKKQLIRSWGIISTLPVLLLQEYKRKKTGDLKLKTKN